MSVGSAQQIVEVPIPQIVEENDDVVRLFPQERVQRIDEQMVEVAIPHPVCLR